MTDKNPVALFEELKTACGFDESGFGWIAVRDEVTARSIAAAMDFDPATNARVRAALAWPPRPAETEKAEIWILNEGNVATITARGPQAGSFGAVDVTQRVEISLSGSGGIRIFRKTEREDAEYGLGNETAWVSPYDTVKIFTGSGDYENSRETRLLAGDEAANRAAAIRTLATQTVAAVKAARLVP